MKKLLLSLGIVTVPLMTIVACGQKVEAAQTETKTEEKPAGHEKEKEKESKEEEWRKTWSWDEKPKDPSENDVLDPSIYGTKEKPSSHEKKPTEE